MIESGFDDPSLHNAGMLCPRCCTHFPPHQFPGHKCNPQPAAREWVEKLKSKGIEWVPIGRLEKLADRCARAEEGLAAAGPLLESYQIQVADLQAKVDTLRAELELNTRTSDSYGVPGSDFYTCAYCAAESGAGLLNNGIPHESTCILYDPCTTMNTDLTKPQAATIALNELPVLVGDGRVAKIPFPMTEEDFELLIQTLGLWRKRLIEPHATARADLQADRDRLRAALEDIASGSATLPGYSIADAAQVARDALTAPSTP